MAFNGKVLAYLFQALWMLLMRLWEANLLQLPSMTPEQADRETITFLQD